MFGLRISPGFTVWGERGGGLGTTSRCAVKSLSIRPFLISIRPLLISRRRRADRKKELRRWRRRRRPAVSSQALPTRPGSRGGVWPGAGQGMWALAGANMGG